MRNYLPIPNLNSIEVPLPLNRFVWLGGTCNGSSWREKLISMLAVSFFNPVVPDWTEEDILRENQAKAAAEVLLYVVTPKQLGFFVLVELTAAACTYNNKKIVIVFLPEDDGIVFEEHQVKSLMAAKDLLLKRIDLEFFDTLDLAASYLNKYLKTELAKEN